MAKGLISAKYLYDIAEAIRVKSGSQSTITPAQMAAAIANIDGTLSGSITPSTSTDKGLITDSIMSGIANAIRAKLDVATQYTPAQMADAILSITAAGPTIVSWASGSDADVAAMIDAAQAGTIDLQQDGGWAVGDVRTISLSEFTDAAGETHAAQSVDIAIASFDEYMNCGNVLQFDFKDCVSTSTKMDGSATTAGGYGGSLMKTDILPALVEVMPNWIKQRLIEFSVVATQGNWSTTLETITGNKLALRSEYEIFGSKEWSQAIEGVQIPYYLSADNRKKKNGREGSFTEWWERSPCNNKRYCRVTSNGTPDKGDANGFACIAPFGCL